MNYALSQEQTKQAIELAIQAKLPIIVNSVGGAGKSEIIKNLGEKYQLEVIDIRLGQLTKFDLTGYPDIHNSNPTVKFKPLEVFPTIHTPIPQGKQGFVLFLDELLQADKYVQGACFKLALDRMVGDVPLHPNTVIVAASNGVINSGADHKMIAPLKSRFIHIDMKVNAKEFQDYVENEVMLGNWNSMLLGFIKFKPEHIDNFDPNTINDMVTYACPRTLHMLSKQMDKGLVTLPPEVIQSLAVGTIGESAGNDFVHYLEFFSQLPSIANIVADPDNCPLPENIGAQWALSTLLLNGINPTNINELATYIERIPHDDIKVITYRTLVRKCPKLATLEKVQNSMGLLKIKLNQVNQ